MLGTERLATELVRSGTFRLPPEDILEARQRLARAFQEAWIDESQKLCEMERAAISRNEAP